ncbi:MAG: hypothetical protein HYV24_01265 [Deltaproteobacteria bacterium]|nr:hypothetical protein [Deltaproteobacteria bacterium]
MTREAYHKALNELQDEVMKMSAMVGTAIKESIEALKSRDIERSRRIVKNDMLINRMRFDIFISDLTQSLPDGQIRIKRLNI